VSGSKWETEVNDLVIITLSSNLVETGSYSSEIVTNVSQTFPITSKAGLSSSNGFSVSTTVEIIAR